MYTVTVETKPEYEAQFEGFEGIVLILLLHVTFTSNKTATPFHVYSHLELPIQTN